MADLPERGPVQHVHARSGFAYGVIGADLHVFGDGVPVYLLENWRPRTNTDPEWLRALPSRLLNARYGVVPFTGRGDELTQLHTWRRPDRRLAARWLYGPGGAGKSRLADEFAAACLADGWKVVTAVPGPGSLLAPRGSQDLQLEEAAGLLLVVDYADRWPYAHLTWLLSNALLHQIGMPTRVLLIGRTADAAPRLRGVLTNLQADLDLQALAPLPPAGAPRTEMFDAARDAFARAYDAGDLRALAPPAELGDPELGLTLAVHMAALVAVDAHVHDRRPPAGMAGLTSYLLDREQVHWATRYADPDHCLDPRPGYRTPPEVMNQVVYAAALTGDLAAADGVSVLRQVGLGTDPETTLADHRVCYPPAPAGPDRVLAPLYPDRLAEDFLALTLPGHPAPYPAQQWAAATSRAIVTASGLTSSTDPARALTFLAAAADRWPHVGRELLYPLLTEQPDLIVEAGNAALIALAGIGAVDMRVLETIAGRLPAGRHVALDVGMAAVLGRLTAHRLTLATGPAERARLHGELSATLANAGRREEALDHARTAADLLRALGDPGRRDLAGSLTDLSGRLDAVGAAEEALDRAWEAVSIWDDAGEHGPGDARRAATAVLHLGIFLARLGRHEESRTALLRAVVTLRRLSDAGETTHRSRLASALNSLALALDHLGDHAAAAAASEEAVAINLQLADEDWTAHLPDLAAALTNLGGRLSSVGRSDEALATARHATTLYRELTRMNPATYRPLLAAALVNESGRLWAEGHHADALTSGEEALAVHRLLAEAMPAAYSAELATSLRNVATFRSATGGSADAVPLAEEAVAIRRRLAGAAPRAQRPDLAGALTGLADTLATADRTEEALLVAGEAVALYRRLADTAPRAHLPELAYALARRGDILTKADRAEEALNHLEQAAAIHRELGHIDSAGHAVAFGTNVLTVGVLSAGLGHHDRALAAVEEAVWIFRARADSDPRAERLLATALLQLSTLYPTGSPERANAAVETARRVRSIDAREPEQHASLIVAALTAAADALADAGDDLNAAAHLEDLVARYRTLAVRDPGTPLENPASALNTLGNLYARSGRDDEAMAATTESAALWRRLAAADADRYLPELGLTLDNLRNRYVKRGRIADTHKVSQEAVEVYRRLAAADPSHGPDLARSLHNLSLPLAMAGRDPEALAASWEATGLFRQLAEEDADAYLADLAMSLYTTGNRYAGVGRTDEAVRHLSEALALASAPEAADVPEASALRDLTQQSLTSALAELPEPPELTAPSAVLKQAFLETLAWSQQSQDLLAVERAIRLGRVAVSADQDPEDWATAVTLLGMVLHTKYAAINDRAALAEAVQALRRVGAHMAPNHRTAPMSHFHLGMVLRAAYEDSGDAALLDEAIAWLRASGRHRHASQAQALGALGTCLGLASDLHQDPAPLPEAVWAAREAVAVCRRGQRPLWLFTLAGTLAHVHRATGDVNALREAVEMCQASVQQATDPQLRAEAQQTSTVLRELLRAT